MTQLTPYYATDRRVYNGALCSDMEKQVRTEKLLMDELLRLDPTARCTYYHNEGHLVHINADWMSSPKLSGPMKELTGKFHHRKQDALYEAIKYLEDNNDLLE